MPNTPEYLARTLERERQDLLALIDPTKVRFKIGPDKRTDELKFELLSIARDVFAHVTVPQAHASFELKRYSAKYIDTLAQVCPDDPDCEKLTAISLAIERVFVAAFALQFTI